MRGWRVYGDVSRGSMEVTSTAHVTQCAQGCVRVWGRWGSSGGAGNGLVWEGRCAVHLRRALGDVRCMAAQHAPKVHRPGLRQALHMRCHADCVLKGQLT